MEPLEDEISIENVLLLIFSKFAVHYCLQDHSRELAHVVWFIVKMIYNSYYSSNSKFKKLLIVHLVLSIIHLGYDFYVYIMLPNDTQLQHILIHLPSILHDLHMIFNKTDKEVQNIEINSKKDF